MDTIKQSAPNRLINSSSPYLLDHAHQPVRWHEWGEQAFDLAKKTGKPIFLSVGYSTCYWCHVMARKVFDNQMIAGLMNDSFVNIKVDREQRPDVDEIYMTAAQLLTGRGGWPNNVFLTPPGAGGENDSGLKPFWAGTYLPPEPVDRMPSFPQVLTHLSKAWGQNKDEIIVQADKVSAAIKQIIENVETFSDNGNSAASAQFAPDINLLTSAAKTILSLYDKEYGGFAGSAAEPKFPQPVFLKVLYQVLQSGSIADNLNRALLLKAVEHSLVAMACGGIWDQIGGGFHRYSTDGQWRVPHFEKMGYDNGQLLEAYARGFEISQDKEVKKVCQQVCRGIADYLKREMTDASGLFYSAQDAEVGHQEGANYLWTLEQFEDVLGDKDLVSLAKKMYGLDNGPNFRDPHDRTAQPANVLYLAKTVEQLAQQLDESQASLQEDKHKIDKALLTVRLQRAQPATDDKVLTSWNGMIIAGLAEAGRVFKNQDYLNVAKNAAAALSEQLTFDQDKLYHMTRQGKREIDGFLEDYAFFVHGLLALYKADARRHWLELAEKFTNAAIEKFSATQGGYYDAAQEDERFFVRPRSARDGAVPSANGRMILNLIELGKLTGKQSYLSRAEKDLARFSLAAKSQPAEHGQLSIAAALLTETGAAPITATARSRRKEDALLIDVDIKIAKGFHIYANSESSPFAAPTVLEMTGSDDNVKLSVNYPDGREYKMSSDDVPYKIYEGNITINVVVSGANEDEQIELALKCQPCTDSYCLPPVNEVLKITQQD